MLDALSFELFDPLQQAAPVHPHRDEALVQREFLPLLRPEISGAEVNGLHLLIFPLHGIYLHAAIGIDLHFAPNGLDRGHASHQCL